MIPGLVMVVVAPAHLAGAVVRKLWRDGTVDTDRPHPTLVGRISVAAEDTKLVALAVHQVVALRRQLGPAPETADVVRALRAVLEVA